MCPIYPYRRLSVLFVTQPHTRPHALSLSCTHRHTLLPPPDSRLSPGLRSSGRVFRTRRPAHALPAIPETPRPRPSCAQHATGAAPVDVPRRQRQAPGNAPGPRMPETPRATERNHKVRYGAHSCYPASSGPLAAGDRADTSPHIPISCRPFANALGGLTWSALDSGSSTLAKTQMGRPCSRSIPRRPPLQLAWPLQLQVAPAALPSST